jgi:hypothetical protein
MVLMMVLAISIFIMSLKATRPGGGLKLVPLSLAISLLFGLPALRNIQPDVPYHRHARRLDVIYSRRGDCRGINRGDRMDIGSCGLNFLKVQLRKWLDLRKRE